METIKQYLPWIIGLGIVLYILRKATSKTQLAPQTQITQTAQPDPFADMRLKAFEVLTGLGIVTAQSEVEKAKVERTFDLETQRIASEERVNLAGISAGETLSRLNIFQREQDRQVQQSAIDRYYSSRTTNEIIGSVLQGINTVFGNRGSSGNIFRTPPISGGFSGGF